MLAVIDKRTTMVCLRAAGQVQPVTEPFETLMGEIMDPPFHVHCFPEGTEVEAWGVEATSRRWYSGDLVELQTRGGARLSGTPNHPVLTSEGWVALGTLREGDRLVRRIEHQRFTAGRPDDEHVVARIEQVERSLGVAGPVNAVRVPVATEDFHGDGTDGYVDVVAANRQLRDALNASVDEGPEEAALVGVARRGRLARLRETAQVLLRGLRATARLVGSGLSVVTWDAIQTSTYCRGGDTEAVRDAGDRLSTEVGLDDVVVVQRKKFQGFVLNLQTAGGWYVANGIVVHNCRSMTVPYMAGFVTEIKAAANDEIMDRPASERRFGPDGYEGTLPPRAEAPSPGTQGTGLSAPAWLTTTDLGGGLTYMVGSKEAAAMIGDVVQGTVTLKSAWDLPASDNGSLQVFLAEWLAARRAAGESTSATARAVAIRDEAAARGYDGVVFRDVDGNLREVIALADAAFDEG